MHQPTQPNLTQPTYSESIVVWCDITPFFSLLSRAQRGVSTVWSTCQSRLSGRFVSFQTTLCEKCGDSFSMNPFIFLSDVTIVIISLMDTSKSFSNIQICNTNSTFLCSLLFSKPQNYEFENIFWGHEIDCKVSQEWCKFIWSVRNETRRFMTAM